MSPRTTLGRSRRVAFVPAVVLAVYLLIATTWSGASAWLLPAYLVLSAFAYLLYARDKRAAVAGERRTPERTLLLVSLLGGWPGAVVAQQWLRHKNRKTSFQLWFWLGVLANVLVLLVLSGAFGSAGGLLARPA